MLQAILRSLTRRKALRTASEARRAAYTAYRDARARNDSRSLHYAQRALRDATTAVVRLELGR